MLAKLDRLRVLMEKNGLDAVGATHPINVFYLSEFPKETPYYELGADGGRSIGFNLENTVLVTKRGNEILSKCSKDSLVF